MSPKPVYGRTMLAELFNLRNGEIDLFVASEGIPVFHFPSSEFVGYLPTLASYFTLDQRAYDDCLQNVAMENYKASLSSTVVAVQSLRAQVPASSSILHPEWMDLVGSHLDVNENTRILIPGGSNAQIFTGHSRFIERLADDFPGGVAVIKAETIQRARDKAKAS